MKEIDAQYAAELAARKAFRGPETWAERRGTRWQHRGCSTPGCTREAIWMIAHEPEQKGARFACGVCKAKKYRTLEEAQL